MLPVQVFGLPEGVVASKAAQYRERQFIQARAHLKGTLDLLALERNDCETAVLIATELRERAEAQAQATFDAGGGYRSCVAEALYEARAVFALADVDAAIAVVTEVLASYTPQETVEHV